MIWKHFVYQLIVDYCNNRGNRTFTLQEFKTDNYDTIISFRKTAKTPFNTLRRVLQELRDEKLLSFIDNSGTYTLRGIDLLKGEIDDDKLIQVKCRSPEKKEHLIETFVRNIGWVREARKQFGLYCMSSQCKNTFLKEDGERYIEVHHIIPLCKGGEDGIWNLAVLCAHHHRVAHYANTSTKLEFQNYLLREVRCRL